MRKLLALILVLSLCFPYLMGCEEDDTKIGYVGCLTGTNSELGVSGMYGALLAIEKINKSGGIKGKNLELIIKDDEDDINTAIAVDKELYHEGCIAIIGHMTSDMAELTVPYINENKILMISPTIAKASLEDIDDYFFRLIPSTKEQAKRIAEEIKEQKIKKVQVLYSEQNVVFANCVNYFLLDDLEQHEVKTEMLGAISFKNQTNENEQIIDKIANSDADGLVIIASADIVSELAQSLYSRNIHKTVFLPAWSMTNDLTKRGGASVEGYYSVNFVDYDSTAKEYTQFKSDYLEKYGDEPTFASILSYESVMVLSSAMNDSKNFESENLKASISKIRRFQGLQGELVLNRFGDIKRDIYLYQIRGTEFIKVDE